MFSAIMAVFASARRRKTSALYKNISFSAIILIL
jgi:hypothetical protein